MDAERPILPFAAIVGQEQLKLALLLVATNPRLGGVLIRGEKGTAKSTAARALARLLPPIRAHRDCPYGCDAARPASWCAACRGKRRHATDERPPPFVTMPLGITEDQLLGSIDLEHALKHGERRFEPGLLARVNQGVLYVDEVNLLDDHLVDLLLDAAASGANVVAREGVRVVHPAEFMLIGTMNPEEGELRPQLVDRFGLSASVVGLSDPDVRAEIVARSLAFETDPEGVTAAWADASAELRAQIAAARAQLPAVRVDDALVASIVQLSLELGVDGHRADILMVKTCATLAALAGRDAADGEDLERAARLVYPHRLRRHAFDEAGVGADDLAELAAAAAQRHDGGREQKKKRRA